MRTIPESEAELQEKVIGYAQLNGWTAMHVRKAQARAGKTVTPTSIPGWPDLTLWRPDARCPGLIFAELKSDRGTVSPEQRIVLADLDSAGAEVHVWRPRDWAEIEARLKRPRR